jgi:hypothetical protein
MNGILVPLAGLVVLWAVADAVESRHRAAKRKARGELVLDSSGPMVSPNAELVTTANSYPGRYQNTMMLHPPRDLFKDPTTAYMSSPEKGAPMSYLPASTTRATVYTGTMAASPPAIVV